MLNAATQTEQFGPVEGYAIAEATHDAGVEGAVVVQVAGLAPSVPRGRKRDLAGLSQVIERCKTATSRFESTHGNEFDPKGRLQLVHRLRVLPLLHCFKADPPTPIIQSTELVAVRIEHDLLQAWRSRGQARSAIVALSKMIKSTFEEPMVVIFYDSVPGVNGGRETNRLLYLDESLPKGDERTAFLQHLAKEQSEAEVLDALNPRTLEFWRFEPSKALVSLLRRSIVKEEGNHPSTAILGSVHSTPDDVIADTIAFRFEAGLVRFIEKRVKSGGTVLITTKKDFAGELVPTIDKTIFVVDGLRHAFRELLAAEYKDFIKKLGTRNFYRCAITTDEQAGEIAGKPLRF